ncbi:MAG: hypothetical protein NTV49_14475 [Kiritimatiellaeota bacterium]|nr:hypothetical protein [Kiritimatiellota bacterium]
MTAPATGKAFAVLFQDFLRWDVGYFRSVAWQWPKSVLKPLGTALTRTVSEVSPSERKPGLPVIEKISFGGELSHFELSAEDKYKGRLFWAANGELIFSKIRMKQGSVAVLPTEPPRIAVSPEYPVYELAITLRAQHDKFVHSFAFLPLAAEVYAHQSKVDPAKGANTEAERLRRAERWLQEFARWFDRVGAADMPMHADPSVLWTVFKSDFDKRAGKVFVAMSFTDENMLKEMGTAIDEALDQFNAEHPHCPLAPRRADKQKGASYEIPAWIFSEIDDSRLLIADLTDERPNVYCEVGYAKCKGVPFMLTFHKRLPADKPPWERESSPGNKVHFDLQAYRYIAYDNAFQLRDRLKQELDAWNAST